MKNRSFVKTLALSTLLLCGAAMAQNTLRIGFFPDPYADQFKPGVLPALERAGTKVNATEFSNIIQRKDSAQVSHTTAPGVHAAVAGSSVDSACAAIREAIRSGRFAGGDRIREVEVCALARVSRTSVRQALTLLAAEGFVELRPNRGAVVIDWTDANLLEIFDLRALLEGYGAALAAGRATRDEVEQMRREALNFQALTRKPQALDMRLIAESNNRLHRMILDAGKNQRVPRC